MKTSSTCTLINYVRNPDGRSGPSALRLFVACVRALCKLPPSAGVARDFQYARSLRSSCNSSSPRSCASVCAGNDGNSPRIICGTSKPSSARSRSKKDVTSFILQTGKKRPAEFCNHILTCVEQHPTVCRPKRVVRACHCRVGGRAAPSDPRAALRAPQGARTTARAEPFTTPSWSK